MPDMRRKVNRKPIDPDHQRRIIGLGMMTGLNITLLPKIHDLQERVERIEKELGIDVVKD